MPAIALRAGPSGPLVDIIDPELVAAGRVVYVNGHTLIPVELQTGSDSLPYSTLRPAIASLISAGGVVVIAPGDYSTEVLPNLGTLEWTLTNVDPHPNYVFGGIGPNAVGLPAISGAGSLNIVGCRLRGAIVQTTLRLDSCWVEAPITTLAMDGFDNRFTVSALITITTGMMLTDCEFDSANITCLAANTFRLYNCALFTSFTVTSPATTIVRIDQRTCYAFDFFVPTFTGASLTVEGVSIGSGRQIVNTAITGNAGILDIAALQPGGSYILQPPTANFNIDGFTAKQAGFWFDLVFDSAVSNLIGTLNYDVGAALTSMRTPQNAALHFTRNTTLRMRYQFNRWRVEVLGSGFGNVLPLIIDPIFNRAVPFVAYRSFAAGAGGAPDDVTIVNAANLTFPVRVLDAWLHTLTPVVGSTCHVRSAAGGAGTGLTSLMASAAAGVTRNNDSTTRNAIASEGLFLRRSDSGVAGDITLLLVRTG